MKRSLLKTCSLVGFVFLLAGCSWWARKVSLGEEFTLHPNEKVRLAGQRRNEVLFKVPATHTTEQVIHALQQGARVPFHSIQSVALHR